MLALGFYLIFGVAVLITIGCAHRRLKHHQALDEAEMRKIANAGLKNAELISTAVLTNTPIAQEGVGSEGTRSAGG